MVFEIIVYPHADLEVESHTKALPEAVLLSLAPSAQL